MSEIVWEDPPATEGRGSSRAKRAAGQAFAQALRSKPGQWARWHRQVGASFAGSVRRGQFAWARPAGAYEARWKGKINQPGTVWVRYVGERQQYTDTGVVCVDANAMPREVRSKAYRLAPVAFRSGGDGSEVAYVPRWFATEHHLPLVEDPAPTGPARALAEGLG